MLRKFYLFKPRTHREPLVAALSYFNTKNFEDGCRSKGIECMVISEQAATSLLQQGNGIGVGAYTVESRIRAPEGLKRQIALRNRRAVVDITGVLVVDEPIRLEPIKELVLAN